MELWKKNENKRKKNNLLYQKLESSFLTLLWPPLRHNLCYIIILSNIYLPDLIIMKSRLAILTDIYKSILDEF